MNEPDTIERDEVSREIRDEMTRLTGQFSLFIPARDFHNWRPTQRKSGNIQGIVNEVEIVATNGLLAYFLLATNELFFGHIQKFSGKVLPMFSVTTPRKAAKPKKKAKSKTQQALDLL